MAEKGKIITVCRKCKINLSAACKFCPSCGVRIGFGIRSENDIRAAINEINNTSFVVLDPHMKPVVMSDIALITFILEWVVGDKDESPATMMAASLKKVNNIRRDDVR